jgi:NAD(P)H-dependent flavin oxidoreductase YrpB (nitropropane dioxygenase family)
MIVKVTQLVGCEFPLFAFSHCRDVVAAVSQAGGFGVLGASGFTPQQLELELAWIDAHVDGKPYGVDVLVPENLAVGPHATLKEAEALVPPQHRQFVHHLLAANAISMDIEPRPPRLAAMPDIGEALMDVAFRHPIRLIANALGIAPPSMLERGKAHGVPVAALVGAKEHAVRQVLAGVDILVAQGGEAGGHCGEVSTMVLVPEVIAAVRPVREVPVLAAGGIMTGRQMAGCMAMGAAGVWTGSVWLATTESETSEIFREKMVSATSRDTVRSKARTGKPSRQLRSTWHDAWEGPQSPGSLPMPIMGLVSTPAFAAIDKAAAAGNPKAREMVSYFVGQGVGLVDGVRSAKSVVQSFKEDFAESLSDLIALAE